MSEEPIVAAKHEGEEDEEQQQQSEEKSTTMSRKEKRKEMKKKKRKEKRRELAEKEREEEVARLNDPEELKKMELLEEEERLRMERERIEFEERERVLLEKIRKEDEEEEERRRKKALDDSDDIKADDNEEETDWEYVEEGPAEIIWKGNEIIVKKKKVRVPKTKVDQHLIMKDVDRPTSNPLPPQSEAFTDYNNASKVSAPEVYENVALQVPNFGTEQDKSHCPFHIKTGACRFGQRCKRVHFYPDKSCTLLIKNMYNGPGLAWEQDEGLEYTDEEVECSYEEFYEDVHTEFLKFGEIVNFKVCRNGSFHLRGNVYVHFKSLESAMLAYQYINGRFFAGKQLTCEYVGVTKWKIAICGEYMKSRLKTCSRGTACNFIHCFRNPGGDYEWADWDKPPPRYWVKKMTSLFGYSDDSVMESESRGRSRSFAQISPADESRHRSRRSKSRETDGISSGSGRRLHEKNGECGSIYYMNHRSDKKERSEVRAEKKREYGTDTNDHHLHKREVQDSDRYDGQAKKARRHHSVLESKDDYGDSRSRETDSAEYVSDFDMERDTSHGQTRESSRQGSRSREADSDEYVSDTYMKRGHGRLKERSRHRSGAREADLDEYVSDTDMKRGHGQTKESSRHRSRAREADSDEYVSDTDMKRDTRHGRITESSRHRSRAREAHSDEYVSDIDMKRDTPHGRTRESSRHRKKENRDHRRKMSTDSNSGRRNRSHENEELSKLSDDYGDKKNMNAESNTERDISEGRLKETRHGCTRKSTRHSRRGSGDLNGGGGTRKSDRDSDSGGERSDREKGSKKYHHRKRKSSTHRNDHRETKKRTDWDELERMPVK